MRFRHLLLLITLLFAAPQADAQSRPNEYVVRSGDTLYRIATEHGMSVPELRQLNNLGSNLILVGQRLRLSSLMPLPPRPVVGADGELLPPPPPQTTNPPPEDEPPPPPPGGITEPEIPSVDEPPQQPTEDTTEMQRPAIRSVSTSCGRVRPCSPLHCGTTRLSRTSEI